VGLADRPPSLVPRPDAWPTHIGNRNSALGDKLVTDIRRAGDFVGERADATVFLAK